MIITALLKRNSRIWTMWRHHIRLGGQIHGVLFRWKPDNNYSTGPLVREEIALLRKHPCVQLEISGVDLQFAPEPTAAPGHTDLMVTPESIDEFVEANPPPVDAVANAVDLPIAPTTAPLKTDKVDVVSGISTQVSDSPKQLKEQIANALKGTEFQVASPAAVAAIEAALRGKAPTALPNPGTVDKLPPVPAFVRRAQQRSSR